MSFKNEAAQTKEGGESNNAISNANNIPYPSKWENTKLSGEQRSSVDSETLESRFFCIATPVQTCLCNVARSDTNLDKSIAGSDALRKRDSQNRTEKSRDGSERGRESGA